MWEKQLHIKKWREIRFLQIGCLLWLWSSAQFHQELNILVLQILYVFFFSSRRRHTRSHCDWSLDVFSSDLVAKEAKTLDYFSALFKISKLSQSVHAKLETVDALAVPTIPITPPIIEDLVDAATYKKNNLLALSNTMPGNVLGICAIKIGRASCRERV